MSTGHEQVQVPSDHRDVAARAASLKLPASSRAFRDGRQISMPPAAFCGRNKLFHARFLAVLLFLLCAALWAQARGTTFVPVSFDDVVKNSDAIFVGVVEDMRSFRGFQQPILTEVTFRSVEAVKGDVPSEYQLLMLGGEVEGLRMEAAGLPKFVPGKQYVIFTEGNGRVFFPVFGGEQGMYVVTSPPGAIAEVRGAHGNALSVHLKEAILAPRLQTLRKSFRFHEYGEELLQPLTLKTFLEMVQARLGGRNHE